MGVLGDVSLSVYEYMSLSDLLLVRIILKPGRDALDFAASFTSSTDLKIIPSDVCAILDA